MANPKPGEVGWTHPDVKGDTNPESIKALSKALDSKDREVREQMAIDRWSRK